MRIPAGSTRTGVKITVMEKEFEIVISRWTELYLKGKYSAAFYKVWLNPETLLWEMVGGHTALFALKPLDRSQYVITPSLPGAFELMPNHRMIQYHYEGTEGFVWEKFPAPYPILGDVNIALVVAEHFLHRALEMPNPA